MNQPSSSPPPSPSPRQRKILWILPAILLALVVVIFVGMNLGHVAETERGEQVGNESGVPGPHNRP